MKYASIGSELFIKNRQKLKALLKPNSVAIFNSSDIMPTSADGVLPFKQDASFFYLTGIDQEESILIIAPDHPNRDFREILFVKKTDEHIKIWEGQKYTKEEATQVSGIENIKWLDEFESVLNDVVFYSGSIYLDGNEHARNASEVETRTERFNAWFQKKYNLFEFVRAAPIMTQLRAVKEAQEIAQIQKACDITEKGFRRVLSRTQSGMFEYELEAEYAYEFLRNRATGFAYQPIIASGANACVLHYLNNNQSCEDGDLILMDVGAEYANYNADMTRTIPANGRFTKRQRAIYDAVLRVKKAATKMLTVGNVLKDYHEAVGQLMQEELLVLGLITQEEVANQDKAKPAYRKYFMHGTSHHLGLNVHDVTNLYRPFEAGMVFTVEPGIYIPEEGIGVRLEDNIVIRENGQDNLMEDIPIEAEEIEDLMNA